MGIADIISILTHILNWAGPTLFDKIDLPPYYPITLPIDWVCYSLSINLTVLLTLERYYSVCILKSKPNLKHTKIAILCVFIMSLSGNFHQVFSTKWKTEGMNYCSKQPNLVKNTKKYTFLLLFRRCYNCCGNRIFNIEFNRSSYL